MIIPARYRPRLNEGAILTRGIDHNLVIYPQDAWRSLSDQLSQMPLTHPTARALRRLLFSGAVQLSIDRQGRVLIPPYLRDYAGLDGEVLIVGMEMFVELWEPARWQETLRGVSDALLDSDPLLSQLSL